LNYRALAWAEMVYKLVVKKLVEQVTGMLNTLSSNAVYRNHRQHLQQLGNGSVGRVNPFHSLFPLPSPPPWCRSRRSLTVVSPDPALMLFLLLDH